MIATAPALEDRLEQLAAALRPSKRPSFHAFECEDDRLVYDLLSGSVLEVSQPALQLLQGIEARLAPAQILASVQLEGESAEAREEALNALVDELYCLHDAGFLRTEDTSRVAEVERLVAESLMAHSPRKMMLMVQSNCNLACTYCYEVQSGFHSTGTRMDYETGVRSVEFLIQRSGRRRDLEVTFFGGEPLLNFELIQQLVDYCKSREPETGKRFCYQITTNATLLSDEMLAYLVEHEFSVMVSIDGPPDKNDLYRVDLGGRGTGAKAIANAKRLVAAQREAGVREAMIRVTLAHGNSDSGAVDRYLRQQGFRRIMLGASTGRATQKGEWDLQADDLEAMSASAGESVREYAAWIAGEAPRPEGASQLERGIQHLLPSLTHPSTEPSIRCGVGRNMQAITRDGKIYPCHRYAGEDAHQLGTLEEGVDPDKLRAYYDSLLAVKEEHCAKCWARITCGGQCPWYISEENGSIVHPDEESCAGIRKGHERVLFLIHRLRKAGRLDDLRNSVPSA